MRELTRTPTPELTPSPPPTLAPEPTPSAAPPAGTVSPSAAGIPNNTGRPLIGRHGFLRSCGHAAGLSNTEGMSIEAIRQANGRCICMANYIEEELGGWLNSNYDLYETQRTGCHGRLAARRVAHGSTRLGVINGSE